MQPEPPTDRHRNSAAATHEQVLTTPTIPMGLSRPRVLRHAATLLPLALLLFFLATPTRVLATAQPISVTVAGDFQSELGCAGDWQPDCTATQLTYDANDDVWQGTWTMPAGQWQYKAALNGGWDENYGANATLNGPNIPLDLTADAAVKFYYDHRTHWIADNQTAMIATAPGSYQSELGCPSDWDPSCLRSWLEDPDGNGTYQFTTTAIPAGTYETKAAINESWDENYGADGVPNGSNISFTVPPNATVLFTYDPISHVLSVTTGKVDTTTAITSDSPDPSVVGQAVLVGYSVVPASGGGTPTGTVTVSDGTDSCTGTVTAGQCTLTLSSAGARSLTATYAGDSNFSASISAGEPHTVNSPNTPPTATVTNGQCTATSMASGLINLVLFDADGDALSLRLVSNSNPTLVSNADIVIGGNGVNRTMTVTAAARKRGSATITLGLSDGKVTVPVVITVLVGSDKSETLNGTTGTDMVFGLSGQNIIDGNAGNDLLCGGNSNDTISGGEGNDVIDGENGDDAINGGDGSDILRGGSGGDTLAGGRGADFFSGGSGVDTASDLSPGQGDTQDGTIP
jgi:Ca2+-binding RTX toxin-like protein